MAMNETYGFLRKRWWLLVLRGGVALVFGAGLLLWPAAGLLALAFVFGIFSAVDGLSGIAISFGKAKGGGRWIWLALEGVMAFFVGFLLLVAPPLSFAELFALVAMRLGLSGLLFLLVAFRLDRRPGQGVLVLSGLQSLVFSGLLFFAPVMGLAIKSWWLGLWALLLGCFFLAIAVQLRRTLEGIRAR